MLKKINSLKEIIISIDIYLYILKKCHYMTIITRFAPSPTGMLHIGGARTALFNYIFTKSVNGKFLLRIEDTDKERSTETSTKAILDGLKWLQIDYDNEPVYQSSRIARHQEVAKQMVENGMAYYAYDTKKELDAEREIAEKAGKSYRYSKKWRDSKEIPPIGIDPVIRIKVPDGEIIVNDLIKGQVRFEENALDDFIILRSNGDPVYMLAVVVDDHDMGITHVIRGDDHLSNTPKQILIYNAMGVKHPEFGHIPLIHDDSGKKMSKRKNAVAIADYQNLGILPEAMKNYLLNLGWSYKGGDIISEEEAIGQFKIEDIGTSPSRFDMQKLYSINLHYIQNCNDNRLLELIGLELSQEQKNILLKIFPELKKCNNLNDLISNTKRYISDDFKYSQEAMDLVKKDQNLTQKVIDFVISSSLIDFKSEWHEFLEQNQLKFGQVGPILRAMLIGVTNSTSLSVIVEALGKDICVKRILKWK